MTLARQFGRTGCIMAMLEDRPADVSDISKVSIEQIQGEEVKVPMISRTPSMVATPDASAKRLIVINGGNTVCMRLIIGG